MISVMNNNLKINLCEIIEIIFAYIYQWKYDKNMKVFIKIKKFCPNLLKKTFDPKYIYKSKFF